MLLCVELPDLTMANILSDDDLEKTMAGGREESVRCEWLRGIKLPDISLLSLALVIVVRNARDGISRTQSTRPLC